LESQKYIRVRINNVFKTYKDGEVTKESKYYDLEKCEERDFETKFEKDVFKF
jgi:hypothetical protein